MFRVVALGHRAGMIVDWLRAKKNYDDIRFVYCNTDSRLLKEWGKEEDEHILLTGIAQCREAIHDDNELMAVLVTCLSNDLGNDLWEYATEIIYELWCYADYTYCLTSLPLRAGGKQDEALELFNWITDYSNITVLQDDLKGPYNNFPLDIDKGLGQFLDLLLSHPRKGRSSELDDLPFGVWATEKQLWMALNAIYSNNMPEYYKAGTFSFHKSTHE